MSVLDKTKYIQSLDNDDIILIVMTSHSIIFNQLEYTYNI